MTLITRRNALKLGLAGGALLAGSSMAMAQLRIVVEGPRGLTVVRAP